MYDIQFDKNSIKQRLKKKIIASSVIISDNIRKINVVKLSKTLIEQDNGILLSSEETISEFGFRNFIRSLFILKKFIEMMILHLLIMIFIILIF